MCPHFWSILRWRWMFWFGLLWFCRMLPQESKLLRVHSYYPAFCQAANTFLGMKVNSDWLKVNWNHPLSKGSASVILSGTAEHIQNSGTVHLFKWSIHNADCCFMIWLIVTKKMEDSSLAGSWWHNIKNQNENGQSIKRKFGKSFYSDHLNFMWNMLTVL